MIGYIYEYVNGFGKYVVKDIGHGGVIGACCGASYSNKKDLDSPPRGNGIKVYLSDTIAPRKTKTLIVDTIKTKNGTLVVALKPSKIKVEA